MDSFINLVRPWSSLPSMLKLSALVLCPVWVLCISMGDGSFRCSLYLSPQDPGNFPYVLLIAIQVLALITVDHIALVVLGVCVLGSD